MSYRLHVDQNSQDNSILERGTYFRFQSASERDDAIEDFKAKYDVKVLFKCPSDLDLRRGLPVKASGGILGRLKAALVRVSHAVEAWFNKLLGRDVTLSLVIKHTDTGAMGKQGRPLPDPPVWAENPVYERTTLSIRSRSLSDLSPVREANSQDGPPTRSTSTSTSDLTSEKDFDDRSAGGMPYPIGVAKEGGEQKDFLWDNYDISANMKRSLEDFEATPGQRSASELIGRVLPSVQMESSELISHVLAELGAVASELAELAAKPETQGADWVEGLAEAIQAEDKENALERPGKTPR